MLNLIIGAKSSGKTRCVHSLIAEHILGGDSTMIIVPKQFTFDTDKGILSLLGARAASETEVLSFSRLCQIALSNYGGITQPVAKKGTAQILMSLALESLQDKLTVFAKHKNEIALVTGLIKEIDEMKNKGVTAGDLERAAAASDDSLLRAKLEETALIWRTYEAVMSEKWFDDTDMLEKVCDILSQTDFFDGKVIAVDGFALFTAPEYKLIELMLRKAKALYISLCSDDITDSSDLSAFSIVNKTARRLRLIAGNCGAGVGKIIRLQRQKEAFSPEMLHLEKSIYKMEYTAFEEETDKVTIIQSDTADNECDAVARQIKALIRQGQYRCRDIAVVYRSDEKYEQKIKASFKKYSLPFFRDRRQPIINQPLIAYVRNLLMIMAQGYNSDYILRLIKTGLTGLEEDEKAEIENYIYTWDISGKRWLSPFTGNPEGFGQTQGEKQQARLEQINKIREKIIAPLYALRQELSSVSGKKAAEVIYYHLRDCEIDERLKSYALSLEESGFNELALEQEQVWDILMEILDEMANALGDRPVSVLRFLELFDLVTAGKSLGKLPDGFDEIHVCSGDRILTKSAKAVFLVGMNASVFPLEQKSTGLFTSEEKKKLLESELELSDTARDLAIKERFICYNALSSASEQICLSYSTSSGASDKLTESECVISIANIFPRCQRINTVVQGAESLIESEQSAFELLAKLWQSEGDEKATLLEYFKDKEQYRGRLEALYRATSEKNFAFENKKTAQKLFGRDMYFSASQLEVYSKCPFMYFCRYGIKAMPRAKASLDASLGGTVVHYVLEMVLKGHKGRDFLTLSDDEINNEIKLHLRQYMEKYMGPEEEMPLRFSYLYGRMLKVLQHLFKRLVAEFENSDFEPCDFELNIGRNETVKPFTLELEEGSVALIGQVDRVDKMDKDGKRYIRIVDYKTGLKEFNLSDVFYGINMQMLLYLISIWRGGTEFYENITPGGILYFPARLSPCNVERSDSEEKRQQKRMSKGKMNGMLVLDGDNISSMDKSNKSVFIPVKIDSKTGQIKGNFITLSQLERLGEIIDGVIRDMGDSLHKGLVPARPIYGIGHGETCTWCDYKDVCLKEKPEIRYAEKRSHEECLDLLRGEEDEQTMD